MVTDDYSIPKGEKNHTIADLVEIIVRYFYPKWSDEQVAAFMASLQKQATMPETTEAEDETLAELLDEIGVHDARNQADIVDMKQTAKANRTRRMVGLKAKAAELKKCRVALAASRQLARTAKAKGRGKARAKAKAPMASPTRALVPLPPPVVQADMPPAPASPPGVLALEDAGAVAERAASRRRSAEAASSSSQAAAPQPGEHLPRERWPAMYTTPEILKELAPAGIVISLDEAGCRWKAKDPDVGVLPSYGFGPRSGRTRREALEMCLDEVWAMTSATRPANAYVSDVPPALWRGTLDPREERPRKYRKCS